MAEIRQLYMELKSHMGGTYGPSYHPLDPDEDPPSPPLPWEPLF